MTAAPLLRLRALPGLMPQSAFHRSGRVVVLSALIGPLWDVVLLPLPVVSVSVGRGLIVAAAVLLLMDWRRAPRPCPAIPRAVRRLIGGLVALWIWIVINASVWGCRCSGELAGFSELIALASLAAVLAALEPRLRAALLVAIVAGAALTAALTVAGVDGLTPATAAASDAAVRLAGPYGNPNMLAFAIACALPAAIALWPRSRRRRSLMAIALLLVAAVLLLTFSRGGLVAAALGVATVLVARQPRGSRAQMRTIAGLAAVSVLAVAIYPSFAEWRRAVSAPELEAELRARDDSGWDTGAQGLIARGPATIANPAPGVLEVRTSEAQQGVSRAIGATGRGDRVELSFRARALGGSERLRFGLEDNQLGNGEARGSGVLSERWRKLRLRWKPTAASPDARLYLWAPTAGSAFRVREITTETVRVGRPPIVKRHPTQLKGSAIARLDEERRALDAEDTRSRRVGVELSLRAFASEPVRGIGWGQFPAYSTARSDYEALPTHNEYLRFLAELGAIGFALLAFVGGVVLMAVRRMPRDPLALATIGILVTAAAGLVFVNGLVAPAAAFPVALAAAVACARSGPQRHPGAREQP